jgi:transcriptional regulator with XRE-family HTH domain
MDRHLTLREARITRNITIQELAARTSMSPATLRKIDEGRFEELPSGLYARSYVKAFAREVGLDPAEALQRVEHLLPGAPDPLPVLRELQGPTASAQLSAFAARLFTRSSSTGEAAASSDIADNPVATTVESDTVLSYHVTRVVAAAVDACLLLLLDTAILLLISLGADVAPSVLVKSGAISVGLLCAVPTSLYFLLFNGVAGQTPGRRICRLPEPPPHVPLTLDAILRRTLTPASPLYDDERELSRPALAGRG